MLDICCIGHITLDKIVTPTQEVYMPGGTSYYFSYGINSLFQSEAASGCDTHLTYKLVTSLAESEMNAVSTMRGVALMLT